MALGRPEGRNFLCIRQELCHRAQLPFLAPFPLWKKGGGTQILKDSRPGAAMLVVFNCFQQLCPSIQGVAAGTSLNEIISRACVFAALPASSWPLLDALLGSLRVY